MQYTFTVGPLKQRSTSWGTVITCTVWDVATGKRWQLKCGEWLKISGGVELCPGDMRGSTFGLFLLFHLTLRWHFLHKLDLCGEMIRLTQRPPVAQHTTLICLAHRAFLLSPFAVCYGKSVLFILSWSILILPKRVWQSSWLTRQRLCAPAFYM